jgi:hypothetical protein
MTSNPLGLNPQDIVNATVSLQGTAAQALSQNIPLIVGNSDVIDIVERIRTYTGGSTSLTTIAAQFGVNAPEYAAAVAFYDQTPQPQVIKIGRWADGNTAAWLHGAQLTQSQQQLANFTAITAGSFVITFGSGVGVLHTYTGINLSTATSLASVAALITTAVAASGQNITWDPLYARFNWETGAPGANQNVSFASVAGSGVDVSALLGWQTGQGGYLIAGTGGEAPVAALTALRGADKTWYFAHFAISTTADVDSNLTPAALLACAQFIEAASPPSTFGITTNDPNTLLAGVSSDIASLIANGTFKRTGVYYSSTISYAALEAFAIFAGVDYTGNNTATISMFKTLPGVQAETLTETQASALMNKQCSVFVNYSNGVSIIQYGTQGSGNYYDEIHGTDAMAARVQNDLFNFLVTQITKVPQTDAGQHMLKVVASKSMQAFVDNGVVGAGLTWTGSPLGQVGYGDVLTKGYYIYQQPLANQPLANRQARQAVLMQIIATLAGAVQGASVQINVVR